MTFKKLSIMPPQAMRYNTDIETIIETEEQS